jgi:feruloyl esterase
MLINDYYKEKPARFYFYGGSEGGRQALVAVQMFPKDYDGVVANVPSLNKALQYIAKNNVWMSTHNGGWMNKAKIHLLAKATMDLCDGLDGLKDGVISKYRACRELSKPEALRCPDGKDTGDTCLSDKQIAAVKTVRGRFDIGFPLKNGIQSLAGWSVGAEDGPGGYNDQIMAEKAEPKDDDPGSYISGNQFVRYAIMRDANSRGAPDYQKYKQRIIEVSNMSDMSNPDLTPFLKRGGKLILKGNGADYQVGAETVFEYYGNVVKKIGQATVDKFVRIYMNPGVAHGGSGLRADGSKLPDKVDLLGQIDNWVEKGEAPGDLTVVAYEKGVPAATKPMCQFPTYPRYQAGNVNVSGSYVCTAF